MVRRGRPLAAACCGALLLLVVGCADEGKLPTVADVPTTVDPNDVVAFEPTPDPLPPDQVVAQLRDATAAKDVCALLRVIDTGAPSKNDRDGAVAVYRELATATRAAQGFLPPVLRRPWQRLVRSIVAASDALDAAHGDVEDADFLAALTGTETVAADESVERYQLDNCPST